MSFLDNLENNLKNMESREERGSNSRQQQSRREGDRTRARAVAPYLEELRKGPFTTELLNEATRIAHGYRTKVYMTWLDSTLRLEAREHRLELRATPDGVKAEFCRANEASHSEMVELTVPKAKALAEKWMKKVGPRPAAPAE
jgi:hypothetical protein